jgi:hypothetical protein
MPNCYDNSLDNGLSMSDSSPHITYSIIAPSVNSGKFFGIQYLIINKLFDNNIFDDKTFFVVSLTASGLYYLIKNRNKKLKSYQKLLKNITHAALLTAKLCTINYMIPQTMNHIKCGLLAYGGAVYLLDFIKKYICNINDTEDDEPVYDIIKQNKIIYSSQSSGGTVYNFEYNLTIPLLMCFAVYTLRD